MRIYLLTLCCLALMLSGCGNGRFATNLCSIDSLLSGDLNDSAYAAMRHIDGKSLQNANDIAYYNLLKSEIIFRKGIVTGNDSLLDSCRTYFSKVGNHEMLSRVLYLKSRNMYGRGEKTQAMICMKEARKYMQYTSNNPLKAKILINLSVYYGDIEDYNQSLEAAKASIGYAVASSNPELIVKSLENTGNVYGNLDRLDSAIVYMERCIPFTDRLTRYDQAAFWGNLAAAYEIRNPEKSKNLAMKSISIQPLDFPCLILGSLYAGENKMDSAGFFFHKALNLSKSARQKLSVYTELFDLYKSHGDYKQASVMADSISVSRQEAVLEQKKDSVNKAQLYYDIEESLRTDYARKESFQIKMIVIGIIGLVCLICTIIYSKNKKIKSARDEYRLTADKLDKANNDYNRMLKEARQAKRKLKSADEKYSVTMARQKEQSRSVISAGHRLWKQIMDGGTIITWTRDDVSSFLQYYSTIDDKFAAIVSAYVNLSLNQQLIKAIYCMYGDYNEVRRIMGMSKDALKVNLYRIEKKRKS